ncbi:MAG: MarR family transcriptional regulator [Actinobacteria bacterium]|nr:MarR family transcriptional regulator [Actinomycetota bacterium]
MATRTDPALVASELRVVLGQLHRRLRAENRFSLSQGSVLGRLDRGGLQSVSELAVAERVRPQSMAQTVAELEAGGLVVRRRDAGDQRRALLELTPEGHVVLDEDRRQREGWLVGAIESDLSAREQALLSDAVTVLRRLVEN